MATSPRGGTDKVKYTVLKVDLDIDSDISGDFDGPENTIFEDLIEEASGDELYAASKFIVVNDFHQDDASGVPAYADGYNNDAGVDADNSLSTKLPNPTPLFVPVTVKISEAFADFDDLKIIFEYPGKDDTKINVNKSGKYPTWEPNTKMRLWKFPRGAVNGDSVRDGGEYIPPGVEFTASQLGLTPGEKLDLYVEGMQHSGSYRDTDITFTVKAKESGESTDGGLSAEMDDAVNLSIIQVDLDIDTDNNNGFNEPDMKPIEDN